VTERKDCELAMQLMHSPIEHINKGLGWYLHNGAFILQHADRIFVGTLENLEKDLARLAHWLNISLVRAPPPTRVSPPSNRDLNHEAKAHIRAYYNKTTIFGRIGMRCVSADY
jgi:hypothetical protein